MGFLRFVASIPKRLYAASLGAVLLPLAVVKHSLEVLFEILYNGAIALFLIPLTSLDFFPLGLNAIVSKLLVFLVVIPLTILTVGAAELILIGILIAITAVDVVKNILIGLTSGLLNGMEGFNTAYTHQGFLIPWIIEKIAGFPGNQIRESGNHIRESGNDMGELEFDGYQRIVGELVDVPVIPEEYDLAALESKTQDEHVSVLTQPELNKAKALLSLDEQVNPEILEQSKILQEKINRYEADRLAVVRKALETGDNSLIDDEIIQYTDVKIPIFFVKQYVDDGKWVDVPPGGHVSDKENLLNWLKIKATHPLNRDHVKNPPQYNGKQTQYIWYELTEKNCYSEELIQWSNEIRKLTSELSDLVKAELQLVSVGTSPHSMYSQVQQSENTNLEVNTSPQFKG